MDGFLFFFKKWQSAYPKRELVDVRERKFENLVAVEAFEGKTLSAPSEVTKRLIDGEIGPFLPYVP